MVTTNEECAVEIELLKRFGGKWAVLAALSMRMSRKHILLPPEIHEKLRIARVKISSGCFSPCEVGCVLAEVEGQLSSRGHLLDNREFMDWSRLLSEAMQGKLDHEQIGGIAALAPIKNDCQFLGCHCGDSGRS